MPVHHSIRNQRPIEQVYERWLTGWPNTVETRIRRKIGALQRHGAFHLKVGITNRPAVRWRNGYRKHGWVEMHLIYRSGSHEHVCDLERRMIDRFGAGLMASPCWYYNLIGGGGGPKPRYGPYYLYIVTAPKYARITR